MPKVVDHAERRAEIVASTWRLIARQGFATTSLREINREMGNAYGAVGHYFKNKDQLLIAAFQHVFNATNLRFEARGGAAMKSLEALRALSEEVMPLDEERLLEARIAIPFWEMAITHEDFADVHVKATAQWADQLAV
jgi:AcrR family transcriptional regulator